MVLNYTQVTEGMVIAPLRFRELPQRRWYFQPGTVVDRGSSHLRVSAPSGYPSWYINSDVNYEELL